MVSIIFKCVSFITLSQTKHEKIVILDINNSCYVYLSNKKCLYVYTNLAQYPQ